jgi:hypothetical protein
MARRSNYAELVGQAESAVASVNDPELKRAAFEKVLEDLLTKHSGGEESPSQKRSPRAARHAPKDDKQVTRRVAKGPHAYIQELVEDDFFKKPKTIAEVKAELGNRGHHIALTSLSGPLQKLCQRRTLRRHRAKTGNKLTFNYSNW